MKLVGIRYETTFVETEPPSPFVTPDGVEVTTAEEREQLAKVDAEIRARMQEQINRAILGLNVGNSITKKGGAR